MHPVFHKNLPKSEWNLAKFKAAVCWVLWWSVSPAYRQAPGTWQTLDGNVEHRLSSIQYIKHVLLPPSTLPLHRFSPPPTRFHPFLKWFQARRVKGLFIKLCSVTDNHWLQFRFLMDTAILKNFSLPNPAETQVRMWVLRARLGLNCNPLCVWHSKAFIFWTILTMTTFIKFSPRVTALHCV